MACGDAVKSGVTIDDRRACYMLNRSGLIDDQINHAYGFVFDPDAPSLSSKRFYDKSRNVGRHFVQCLAIHAKSNLKSSTAVPVGRSSTFMGLTMSIPERLAILGCGATVGCIGEVAAARTAQAIATLCDGRLPEDETDFFKYGGDGSPIEASSAVRLSAATGETHQVRSACVAKLDPSLGFPLVVVVTLLPGEC